MTLLMTLIEVYNEKQLIKRLEEIRIKNENLNWGKKVKLSVSPNPSEVTFNNYETKTFNVSLELIEEEEEENEFITFKKECPNCQNKDIQFLTVRSNGTGVKMITPYKHQCKCLKCNTVFCYVEI